MSSQLSTLQPNVATRIYLGGGVREAWARPEAQYFAKITLSSAARQKYAACLKESFANIAAIAVNQYGGDIKKALSETYKKCREEAKLATAYAIVWGTKGGKAAQEEAKAGTA